MIFAVTVAAALAAAPAPAPPPRVQALAEAAHAIEAGRLDQARIMIGTAVSEGAQGPAVDRLLADLAFASEEWESALARYKLLLTAGPDPLLSERAALSAIHLRKIAEAGRLLQPALRSTRPSWRAWNAAGIVADHQRRWTDAAESYGKAASLAPDRPDILNNMGWSLLVQGRWDEAVALLERAAALDPKSPRIADNLELAQVAVSEDLPRRRDGESEVDWAARLNDAGVIARIQGKRQKAIAAFARAIEVRSQWFERAANNLAQTEGKQ